MKIFLVEADTTCSYFKFEYWPDQPSSDTMRILALGKWFEPRSNIPWLKKIIRVILVLRRTVLCKWRFDVSLDSFDVSRDLDSEDGLRTGSRNVSHKEQSFSGLQSPRWSFFNQGNSCLLHVQFLFYPKKLIKKEFPLFLKKVGLASQNIVLKFKMHPRCMAHARKIFLR